MSEQGKGADPQDQQGPVLDPQEQEMERIKALARKDKMWRGLGFHGGDRFATREGVAFARPETTVVQTRRDVAKAAWERGRALREDEVLRFDVQRELTPEMEVKWTFQTNKTLGLHRFVRCVVSLDPTGKELRYWPVVYAE